MRVGDEVQGLWVLNGRWYDAVISELLPDGTVLVDWPDRNERNWILHNDQVRPRAVVHWVQCDKCAQWRSLSKAHEPDTAFSCIDIYIDLGCSQMPDEFYAFDKKVLRLALKDARSQEDALKILRTSFGYLLDKLPQCGSFQTKSKTKLLEGYEVATFVELEDRLLQIQSDLVPRFQAEDWSQSWNAHFEEVKPAAHRSIDDVCHLGWQLEELIDWEKVAQHRRAKRKATQQPSVRARPRSPPSAGRDHLPAAGRSESDLELEARAPDAAPPAGRGNGSASPQAPGPDAACGSTRSGQRPSLPPSQDAARPDPEALGPVWSTRALKPTPRCRG